MSILLAAHILVITSLSYLIWKHASDLRNFFWPALLWKLGCGIGLGLLYKYYYTVGDTFGYYEDGVKIAALARADLRTYFEFLWSNEPSAGIWSALSFQQPRALFLSKIVSLMCLLTADNYWIISLYFSLISFYSAWVLVERIGRFYPGARGAALFAFLFFPSAVFWTSGIIKETLALTCLYFITVCFLDLYNHSRPSVWQWILLPLAVWLVWVLKYYYVAVFLPVAATALAMRFIIVRFGGKLSAIAKGMAWLGIFVGVILIATQLHPNFYPERFLAVIVDSYQEFTRLSAAGDAISFSNLEPSVPSLLQYSPKAILSGLFRPFIWEANNLLQLFSALENTLLVLLVVSTLIKPKRILESPHKLLLFSLVVYVCLLCVFLTLSTPNYGTLSRYRVGFLPYFVLMICLEGPVAHFISAIERKLSLRI